MLRENKKEQKICNTDEFVTFFENLFSNNKNDENADIKEFVNTILQNAESKDDFTMEELLKALKILKNNKAAGPDRIPAEALKACPPNFLKIILKLMNKIKNKMIYPETWTEGVTSLLHKDGDDEDPNNFRAITVTNAISKVLAIMINERFTTIIEEKKILKKEQIGFQKKSRPADHLLVIKTLIDHYNGRGRKLYACFVDFQKAFDSVWRTGMYYKLIHCGIDLSFIKLLKNMYEKTSQRLKFDKNISRKFLTEKGVKQGCILSPKLFNIFINDIPEIFNDTCEAAKLGKININCLMYADDLILISESEGGLQNCLNKLNEYVTKWKLKVNLKKTQVMIFNPSGYRGKIPTFNFDNQHLKTVKEYKYLGTTITNTGNFKLNEVYLKKKGLRATFLLMHSIKRTKPSTSIKLFNKIVEPILTYNCEVAFAIIPKSWDYSKFVTNMWTHGKEVNKVTMSFLRQLLGVHKKCSNIALMSETGKHPTIMKIYYLIYKYWFRIKNCENELLKEAVAVNKSNHMEGKNTWYKLIDFLERLTAINTQEPNKMVNLFKRSIEILFDIWWKNEAEKEKTKLDFYFSIKKNFGYESYLDNENITHSARVATTKFRLSSHCLPIEVLRYYNTDRRDRKCNICISNKVGDEYHYLTKCENKGMVDIRNRFVEEAQKICFQLQNFSAENTILYCSTMKDEKVQEITANFIYNLIRQYRIEDNVPPLQILCLRHMGKIRKSHCRTKLKKTGKPLTQG